MFGSVRCTARVESGHVTTHENATHTMTGCRRAGGRDARLDGDGRADHLFERRRGDRSPPPVDGGLEL